MILLDSVTDAGGHGGAVALAASHGGVFAAICAARAGLRAVILIDAGIGLGRAGVAGLDALDEVGMAAACLDVATAPMGDGAAMPKGRVSAANGAASALGVAPGMAAVEAARRLADAPFPRGAPPEAAEARALFDVPGLARPVVLADSGSLIRPEDAGAIVVTGSHGNLVGPGGHPLPGAPALAVFNDAGGAATSRLPDLATRGVPAACVSHWSARIGDARSTWGGTISALNAPARARGLFEGMRLSDLPGLGAF